MTVTYVCLFLLSFPVWQQFSKTCHGGALNSCANVQPEGEEVETHESFFSIEKTFWYPGWYRDFSVLYFPVLYL